MSTNNTRSWARSRSRTSSPRWHPSPRGILNHVPERRPRQPQLGRNRAARGLLPAWTVRGPRKQAGARPAARCRRHAEGRRRGGAAGSVLPMSTSAFWNGNGRRITRATWTSCSTTKLRCIRTPWKTCATDALCCSTRDSRLRDMKPHVVCCAECGGDIVGRRPWYEPTICVGTYSISKTRNVHWSLPGIYWRTCKPVACGRPHHWDGRDNAYRQTGSKCHRPLAAPYAFTSMDHHGIARAATPHSE